jgi:hypothetical protein
VRRELRRCLEQKRFHNGGEPFDVILVGWITFGVALGEFGDLLEGVRRVLPGEKIAAIGERREKRRILRIDLVAEAIQFQLGDHTLAQQARKIGGGRDTIAGPDLLGHGASAHQVATFEHQHGEAPPRKIGGRGQSIVPAADDDGVVSMYRHEFAAAVRHSSLWQSPGWRGSAW